MGESHLHKLQDKIQGKGQEATCAMAAWHSEVGIKMWEPEGLH